MLGHNVCGVIDGPFKENRQGRYSIKDVTHSTWYVFENLA